MYEPAHVIVDIAECRLLVSRAVIPNPEPELFTDVL
jgi:hypothetical protein